MALLVCEKFLTDIVRFSTTSIFSGPPDTFCQIGREKLQIGEKAIIPRNAAWITHKSVRWKLSPRVIETHFICVGDSLPNSSNSGEPRDDLIRREKGQGKRGFTMRKFLTSGICSLLIASALLPASAISQENTTSAQRPNESTIEGTVVSSTRQTFVVRTADNQFQLFVFNRYTNKPVSMPVGTRVRVESLPGAETGSRLATRVTTLEAAPKEQRAAGEEAAPIPPSVRDVESNIKREARRWRLGVRAGAAFDPELFMFGVHSQMGPIFTSRVFFRPSAEFAFGEVTDLIALNLEAIYRFPRSSERRDWSPYVGGGPAFTFLHQNFQMGRNIDFGNFDFDTGFNILIGMQSRRGTFFEAKTSLYSRPAPILRLIVGYNF